MKNLIAKLEAASKGSRELDCDIFCATAPSPFESHYPDCVLAVLGGFVARVEIDEIPNFTISLDAALTLVPEGWILDSLSDDATGSVGSMKAFGATCEVTNGELGLQGQAVSRALALCIAALKTRL